MLDEGKHESKRRLCMGMALERVSCALRASQMGARYKRIGFAAAIVPFTLRPPCFPHFRLRCLTCKCTSNRYDSFTDMSLELSLGGRQLGSLTEALAAFSMVETLSRSELWNCPACGKKASTKQMTVHVPPAALMVHLKRFSSNSGQSSKLGHHVSFSEQLDLAPVLSPVSRLEGWPSRYRLAGVIVHLGNTLDSGHYISYTRAPNRQWYRANDEHVERVDWNIVAVQQAYMLFYLREAGQPPPRSGPGAVVSAVLQEAGQSQLEEGQSPLQEAGQLQLEECPVCESLLSSAGVCEDQSCGLFGVGGGGADSSSSSSTSSRGSSSSSSSSRSSSSSSSGRGFSRFSSGYMSLLKPELVRLCKLAGLTIGGTKKALSRRLDEFDARPAKAAAGAGAGAASAAAASAAVGGAATKKRRRGAGGA